MRWALHISALVGVILFGAAFAATFLSPIHFERAARGFIEMKIERQLGERSAIIDTTVSETRAGQLAMALSEQHNAEIAGLRKALEANLDDKITAIVDRMQDPGCTCRALMTQMLHGMASSHISTLERAEPQLRRIIEGRYAEIVTDLLRDLRIFAGTNLLAFLLLFALSIARADRIRQLLLPGLLLGATALAASAFYLFGQNWFFTLLHADFTGFAYAAWLMLTFALLCDITLFRARITTRILKAMGAALPAPC
jgi:hypothetical protein